MGKEGSIERQGHVERKIDEKHILVTWFSFMTGEQNGGDIIEIPQNAAWYMRDRDMREAFYRWQIKSGDAEPGWTVDKLMRCDDLMRGRKTK